MNTNFCSRVSRKRERDGEKRDREGQCQREKVKEGIRRFSTKE